MKHEKISLPLSKKMKIAQFAVASNNIRARARQYSVPPAQIRSWIENFEK